MTGLPCFGYYLFDAPAKGISIHQEECCLFPIRYKNPHDQLHGLHSSLKNLDHSDLEYLGKQEQVSDVENLWGDGNFTSPLRRALRD